MSFASSPLVAILTPSFNREDLVGETLDSILAQTYPHWENIVVDDGSTDGTKAVVAAYAARDPRIRPFDRSRAPKGACTCRNLGVGLTSAEYVMFLDTDDILEPFCLEQRVAAMEAHPELDFAIFPSLMFDKAPHDLGLWWNVDKPDEDELSRQFRQDAICQGTGVLWRKDAFERLGMWDEQLFIWQDIELFLRAYIRGFRYAKFFELPPDLHNRVNHASLSRGNFFTPEKTRSRARVVRQAVELLKENGLSWRVREARFMLAEVVSGAARSRQPSIAVELIAWGEQQGVLTRADAAELRRLGWLHRTRVARLPGMRKLAAATERRFGTPSTLGRIPRARVPGASEIGGENGEH